MKKYIFALGFCMSLLTTLTTSAQIQLGTWFNMKNVIIYNNSIFRGNKAELLGLCSYQIPQFNDPDVVILKNDDRNSSGYGDISIFVHTNQSIYASNYKGAVWRLLVSNSSRQMPRFENRPNGGYYIYWGDTKDWHEID
jgi:hypothetical protein